MERSTPIQFIIIMPVYNVEEYLDQSIQSVLAQTYDRFRLVMVDDGSKDNSGKICDDYASQDPRLTVVHQSNKGQIAARQTGLNKAKETTEWTENSYLLFLDSDDWLELNTLETLATHLDRKQCDCLIYGFRRVLNGKAVFHTSAEDDETPLSLTEACRKICMDSTYNSLCRKAVKITAMPETDYSAYYHVRLGEDLLQSLDILRQVKSIAFITDHLYNYRVNSASVTESINYEKFDFDYTVPLATLQFLREADIHTEETWISQWKHFSERMYLDIMKLLFSNHPWEQKRIWLERICNSDYVQRELSPNIPYRKLPRKHQIILRCFIRRKFAFLKLYYAIACLKQNLRK